MPSTTSGIENVTFQTCETHLLSKGNAWAQRAYRAWCERRDVREHVVPFVHNFTHRVLYQLTRADYEAAVLASAHALGDVQSSEQLRAVEDFHTPFALSHLFHQCLETLGHLPTWQDFAAFLKGPARAHYLEPLRQALGYEQAPQAERLRLGRAMQWRLGKYYYSAMREIELLVRLKEEHGLTLRYHVLADVLLRVDFWVEHVLLCVWFGNPRYRTQQAGRKIKAAEYFDAPDFTILDVEIDKQGYGNFWRVSTDSVQALAGRIRAELAARPRLIEA